MGCCPSKQVRSNVTQIMLPSASLNLLSHCSGGKPILPFSSNELAMIYSLLTDGDEIVFPFLWLSNMVAVIILNEISSVSTSPAM